MTPTPITRYMKMVSLNSDIKDWILIRSWNYNQRNTSESFHSLKWQLTFSLFACNDFLIVQDFYLHMLQSIYYHHMPLITRSHQPSIYHQNCSQEWIKRSRLTVTSDNTFESAKFPPTHLHRASFGSNLCKASLSKDKVSINLTK